MFWFNLLLQIVCTAFGAYTGCKSYDYIKEKKRKKKNLDFYKKYNL